MLSAVQTMLGEIAPAHLVNNLHSAVAQFNKKNAIERTTAIRAFH
jgi:hypothetical protein